jgi:serpin B
MKTCQLFGLLGLLLAAAAPSGSAQDAPKAPPDVDIKALVEGNNEFAFDLYGRFAKEEGNIILSPYSISTALAMTYAGARGKTAEQMAKAMHFTLPPERLHRAFGELTRQLEPQGKMPPYILDVANALWPQKVFSPSGLSSPLVKEYQELVSLHYRASLTPLDYASNPEAARQTINRWAAEKTHNMIPTLLPLGAVSTSTNMVLANAAYFKAKWEQAFPAKETKDEDFEVALGKKVKVPMMHLEPRRFKYCKTPEFEAVELPYQDGRMSLLVILPGKRGQLAELEKGMTAAKMNALISGVVFNKCAVTLPRFKFDFERSLLSDLAALGILKGGMDFSGIMANFRLSTVIHKAIIVVDEEGTEAVAATAALSYLSGIQAPLFSFRADHPFMFLLRDTRTGTLLFMGRVTNLDRIKSPPSRQNDGPLP